MRPAGIVDKQCTRGNIRQNSREKTAETDQKVDEVQCGFRNERGTQNLIVKEGINMDTLLAQSNLISYQINSLHAIQECDLNPLLFTLVMDNVPKACKSDLINQKAG